MRRLSETMARATPLPIIEKGEATSWQGLILFDGVLDGGKILESPELEKLLVYFYGQKRISAVSTDSSEELQAWLRDELYKADVNERAMVYLVKTPFDELALPTHSKEYDAPLEIQILKPEADVENDFLLITCKWDDGLFRNDRHIIGVVADIDDLITIVLEHIKRD